MTLLIAIFLLSALLTFIFWKLGEKYGIHDEASNDPLKIHKKSTSVLGGLAMFLAFAPFFIFGMWSKETFYFILAALPVFLVGFVDDLKWRDKSKIKPIYKFLFLIVSSVISAFVFFYSGLIALFLPIAPFILLASLVIFILMNAINYQDGMDGLAGGMVLISLIGFVFLPEMLGSLISSVMIAVIIGFLVFNFPPAKIFMGDSGAYFLGFILAVLFLINLKADLISFVGLIFILGLPLFDGVYTNIRRLLAGKTIFRGDRSHFYDKLLKKGFSSRRTLFIAFASQAMFVVIGLVIYYA